MALDRLGVWGFKASGLSDSTHSESRQDSSNPARRRFATGRISLRC